MHPFERAREYTRALNAVKLERLFAKPFVGQLGSGHVDGVYSMAVDGKSLERVASGSGDGSVKVWDLAGKDEIWHSTAHENIVKGMCWTNNSQLISCASDKTIKLWDPYNSASDSEPVATWLGSTGFTSISHHRNKNAFAVASDVISIYDLERHTAAPEVIAWPNKADTITSVAFNQVETSVIASCATDRAVVLYDVRSSTPVAKTVLSFACNAVAWNPMEAYNFALASENHDVMIFDSRNMSRALNVLKDHVAAVMDVQFSPTGQELVSASYDRTLRIWKRDQGHSREIYHTKRMQRLFAARWTSDSKYVLSGSDDGNVSFITMTPCPNQKLTQSTGTYLAGQRLQDGGPQVDQAPASARVQRRSCLAVWAHARGAAHQAAPPRPQGCEEGAGHQEGGAGRHQEEGGEREAALEQAVQEEEVGEGEDDFGARGVSRASVG